MTVGQLVRDFLTDCERRAKLPADNDERLSRKTIREYRQPLEQVLLPFCERQGITDVQQLTKPELERLREDLAANGARSGRQLKTPTVNSYLRSINACLSWGRKKGKGVEGTVQLYKQKRPHLNVLSRDEISRIENAAERERDRLIVRLLADTGIRVGELINLSVVDLVTEGDRVYLRVRGKTDQRDVPLLPDLNKRLRRYISETRPKRPANDRVFLAARRRPGGGVEALTESGVQQIVRELAETAEIGRRVYPHLFRHSYITYQLGRMPAHYVRDIVGHQSLAMIDRVYSHIKPAELYDRAAQAERGR
jgi:integrase/recombinase XerD